MYQSQVTLTDLIRRMALISLVGYPNGIQLVALRKVVEDQFVDYLDLNDKKNIAKFKNSVWDLDKRFPLYIEKEVLSPKNVILKPTETLFTEVDSITTPNFDEYFSNYKDEVAATNQLAFELDSTNIQVPSKMFLQLKDLLDSAIHDKALNRILSLSDEEKKKLPINAIELLAQFQQEFDNLRLLREKMEKYDLGGE